MSKVPRSNQFHLSSIKVKLKNLKFYWTLEIRIREFWKFTVFWIISEIIGSYIENLRLKMESIRSFSVIENNSIWFESSCRTVYFELENIFSDRSISIERPCTLRTVHFTFDMIVWKNGPKMAQNGEEKIWRNRKPA